MPVDVAIEGVAETAAGAVLAQAEAALRALGLEQSELSLVLCDDAHIRPLNARWRGKDQPTDVLSFPQEEWPDGPFGPGQPVPFVVGDLVISLETAARQAAERGHSPEQEQAVLLVHGLLHLLGHDHQQADQADQMLSLIHI